MCCNGNLQGSILALAYAPGNVGPEDAQVPVMDAVITAFLPLGSAVNFRFYPHLESYQSLYSRTAGFSLDAPLLPGYFIRLSTDTGFMYLEYKVAGGGTWERAAGRSVAAAHPATASCYVYVCGAGGQRAQPASAVGIVVTEGDDSVTAPIFPPTCILDCRYALQGAADASTEFTYFPGDDFSIPGNWPNAWRTLRNQGAWAASDVANYAATVDEAEAAYYVAPTPGQFVPMAWAPSSAIAKSQLAVVVTAVIPPSTVVFLSFNDWEDDSPWLVWTTGSVLCPGSVVSFINLGAETPCVSSGSLLPLPPYTSAITNHIYLTAVTLATAGSVAITGVYTCAYRGMIPRNLVSGVTIQRHLWPVEASVLAAPSCRVVSNWAAEAVALNTACFVRWLCQPVPTYVLAACLGCAVDPPAIHPVSRRGCAPGGGCGP